MSQYLQDQVKSWVTMDNNIRDMADRIKSAKDDKSEVQSNITDYIRDHTAWKTLLYEHRIAILDLRYTYSSTIDF